MLAIREGRTARVLTRNGRDASEAFPEIISAISSLRHDVVLDGELTVTDDHGRPDWHALHGRAHMTLPASIRSAVRTRPALFYAFDLLAVDRLDLRPATLGCRRKALQDIVTDKPALRCAELWNDGIALLRAVTKHQLEGVVAKRLDSPYTSGRNRWWLKVRALTARPQTPAGQRGSR
jgi:bifunctional non-homologous end joining protein LigD